MLVAVSKPCTSFEGLLQIFRSQIHNQRHEYPWKFVNKRRKPWKRRQQAKAKIYSLQLKSEAAFERERARLRQRIIKLHSESDRQSVSLTANVFENHNEFMILYTLWSPPYIHCFNENSLKKIKENLELNMAFVVRLVVSI